MTYMLLVYGEENSLTGEEREQCYRDSLKLTHDLNAAGQYLAASPLHLTSTATSVRLREGKRLVTDGPFAETREQLGGYYLVNVNSLEEAVAIAERIPMARRGTIEVRPVMEMPGLPTAQRDASA
jgi:hypothetical protein